jgi:hypothetical protein
MEPYTDTESLRRIKWPDYNYSSGPFELYVHYFPWPNPHYRPKALLTLKKKEILNIVKGVPSFPTDSIHLSKMYYFPLLLIPQKEDSLGEGYPIQMFSFFSQEKL